MFPLNYVGSPEKYKTQIINNRQMKIDGNAKDIIEMTRNTKTFMQHGKYLIKCLICNLLELLAFIVSLLFKPNRSTLPPIGDKILLLPAVKLSNEIKIGKLTSEQVVQAYIKQIKKVNPIIKAIVAERFEKALDEARSLDKRLVDARDGKGDKSLLELPLIGVPLTVKETISLEGSPFSAGLLQRKSKRARSSNEAVAKLIKAGLVPIGSTNTPCMNCWWDSENLLYGRTKNPYDLSRIPGGSSGGEGAILAAAGSVVGVGSDLAGSIRIPCNFCGVFGHKPTPFTVSTGLIYPAARKEQEKLRAVGPMTRYAVDLLPMLQLMLREDEVVKMRLDEPVDLKKIKIYYCERLGDPFVSDCNADILAGLRAAVEHLSATYGVDNERVELEEFKYGLPLWSAEFEAAAGKLYYPEHEDGIVPFNPILELGKTICKTSEFPIHTIVTSFLEKFGAKYGSKKHLYLTVKAKKLRDRFSQLLGDNGVLLMATHPQPAPYHQTTVFKFLNVAYTALGNTLQAPITQCPLGMTKEGLPFGLQVISKPYNDRITLAVACELEKAFGGWLPPSRITTST